jgi:adenine-specific DNA-methyltransferase
MTNHCTRLKTLLRELFQFDAADLDFGIYRIMNQRRAEIDDFIQLIRFPDESVIPSPKST